MTGVCKLAVCLAAVLTLATAAATATAADDPQTLLLAARGALERGDVRSAESLARSLRAILESDPFWDPDGAFAGRLLPEVEGRIKQLRDAAREFDVFAGRIADELKSPERSNDPENLTAFLGWGSDEAERIRTDMERIIGTLAAGPDRGALLQTDSYRLVAGLAETVVLPGMNRAFSMKVTDLLDEDEQVRILRNRLAALKYDVIASSLERERLDEEIAASNERLEAYQRALVEFIGSATDDAGEYTRLSDLGVALAHRVRDRLAEVDSLEEQSWLGKVYCLDEIERFRLVNVISVSEGSRDLSPRIDALASVIERVPVAGGEGLDFSMGWLNCCMSVCR